MKTFTAFQTCLYWDCLDIDTHVNESSLPTNLLFRFFYFFTCGAIQKSKSPKVFVQIADVSQAVATL